MTMCWLATRRALVQTPVDDKSQIGKQFSNKHRKIRTAAEDKIDRKGKCE